MDTIVSDDQVKLDSINRQLDNQDLTLAERQDLKAQRRAIQDRHDDEAVKQVVETKPVIVKNEPVKVESVKLLKVEKVIGVEIGFNSRYPFDELEVGQGFFVSNEDFDDNHRGYLQTEPYNKYPGDHNPNPGYVVDKHTPLDLFNKEIDRAFDFYGSGRKFEAKEVHLDDVIGEGVKAPADGVLVVRKA